jgi:glutaredoxin-like YruB-family protein
MAAKKIKLYTTPYCTYCKLAKNFLAKNKVTFTEIDISEDEDALKDMMRRSGQMSVPVIEVDGTMVVGFNETKLKKLLGVK